MVSSAIRRTLAPLLSIAIAAGCGGRPAKQRERADLSPPSDWGPALLPPGDTPLVSGADAPKEGRCDPNYEPCVPIDSDVDCAGGSGNGPSYVQGPVRVIGSDPYHLDRDGDGVGCEN